jgi:N-acetylneuraminate lyase
VGRPLGFPIIPFLFAAVVVGKVYNFTCRLTDNRTFSRPALYRVISCNPMNPALTPLQGLVAATFTPLHDDGTIRAEAIAPMVDRLVGQGIAALYVLGSTGEGLSFTLEERCAVAEAFVKAAAKRFPVIVQVGSESLTQAGQLATHAERIGADAISAVSPVYFKPDSVETLVASMAQIAGAAPSLPFYYYHIPGVTGVTVSATEFLKLAGNEIGNLRGIKFTSPNLFEYQTCVEFAADRFEVLWGLDEMLHFGLAAGAKAAVGSTYNFAAPLYQRLLTAYDAGDLETVRREQSRSQAIVRAFLPYGPRGAQKAIMKMIGIDCGPSRLPIPTLSSSQYQTLESELRTIGFFEWTEPITEAMSP